VADVPDVPEEAPIGVDYVNEDIYTDILNYDDIDDPEIYT